MAANAQQVIELVFNGIDKTGAATQAALRNVGQFAGNVQSATQPVADLTKAALQLEAAILAAGAATVVAAIKVAGDFDTAFRQLSTLLGDISNKDLATFRESIQQFSLESGRSLGAVTEAVTAAVGSGVKWSESIALVSTAEKLATATKADLKATTETLVSTLNVYGMSTQDAGKVSDILFKTIADGKLEMSDLSQSLSMVTPVAKAAGIGLDQVGAAIALLTAKGLQPSTSMEYLRGAISGIMAPSQEAKKLADELGLSFGEQALKSKGLAGVLADMNEKTGGSSEKMKTLLGDIGGTVAALILAEGGAKQFRDGIKGMGDAAGSVAEAYKKMAGNLDGELAKVGAAVEALLVRIGTPLLDETGRMATAIANVFKALADNAKSGALADLVTYVGLQMDGITEAVARVARNLPDALAGADLSGFTGGIEVVKEAFSKLFDSIDITTVEGLRSAIELAGAAFLGLSSYVAGVVKSFEPLFDELVKVGSGIKEVDKEFIESLGSMAGFVTQANALAGGLNSLLPALEGLVGILILRQGIGLAGALGATSTAVAGLATALGPTALVAAAGAAGVGIGTLLKDPIDGLVSSLTGSKTTLGGFIYDLTHGGEAAAGMGTKAQAATDGVNKLGESAQDMGSKGAEASADFDKLGNAVGKVVKATEDSRDPFKRANEVMLETFAANEKVAKVMEKAPGLYDSAGRSIKNITPIIDEATGKVIGYEQALLKGSAATTKTADETKKAEDAVKKWNEELAKMNFQEKLKLIESQTKITTAQIEADAKRAVAAFESIATTITSTGDVLGDLFGQMKDFGNMDWSARNLIEEQIEKENKLRQDAFDLQKKLTEAQIDQMRAQTDALIKGDGLIKIDGAGLKPHLEAFMWEILRAIQVKVNKDGLKLLLGA